MTLEQNLQHVEDNVINVASPQLGRIVLNHHVA